MILEKLPRSLKGALSRWLIEVRPGTFLGNPSQRVRDELWKKVTQRPPLGYVLQIWSTPNPQGFDYRQYGDSHRRLVDFEGLALMTNAKKHRKKGRLSEQKSTDNA
jgi:CRISPR-associated protein Cas2